ncbi:MAG: hypothetical protein ABH804_01660 [archaeon]
MVEVRKEDLERVKEQIYSIREKIAEIQGPNSVGEKDFVYIEARDLDDLYFQSVMGALKHGELNPVEEGSHAGSIRLEFPGFGCCVKNPTTRPLAPSTREGIPVATDDEAIHKYFQNYLLDGRLEPNEHYRYSTWISGIQNPNIPLEHKGIPRGTRLNQLEWCVKHFTEKGYGTNHCAITVGCAEGLQRYDWPYKNESERGTTECLRGISLKIRKENQLDVSTFWRSWDLYNGFPENLGGFAHLIEYTANLINATKKEEQSEVKPGRLYAYSDGLHIYSHSLDLAKLWANIN